MSSSNCVYDYYIISKILIFNTIIVYIYFYLPAVHNIYDIIPINELIYICIIYVCIIETPTDVPNYFSLEPIILKILTTCYVRIRIFSNAFSVRGVFVKYLPIISRHIQTYII